MKSVLKWTEGMAFDSESDGHIVRIDAKSPLGKNTGPTPKELVVVGLGGCTAMDVIALLKKHKQLPESFSVTVDVTPSTGRQPAVFEGAQITFAVSGNVDSGVLLDAVRRSQSLYCGVSKMLAMAFPIRYGVELNGVLIGSGEAQFQTGEHQ